MKIKKIDAFQVFDSRGTPTLEVEVILENDFSGSAIVPSGASTGQFEAVELRDHDTAFNGKSVYKAIRNVKELIAPELTGRDVRNQQGLDRLMIELDGTSNKKKLGANAVIGVSMALARAAANSMKLPLYQYLGDEESCLLPLPEIQIIGGGAHTSGRIDVQDFMIICTRAEDYSQCLEMTWNVYTQCGILLKEQDRYSGVADEGGFWPEFDRNEEVFDILLKAIEKAGYQPGRDIHISLDIAASEFYSDGSYHLHLDKRSLSPDTYYELISGWCRNYPVISIEDPFYENDTGNWEKFTAAFGKTIQIVGDDLFTTDIKRVRQGKEKDLANSVLIKLNQIGTVTETLECIRQTQEYGWNPVISARSGETEDAFISHLAVATNAGQLKVGSFTRSERMVKWNEIIRISRTLGDRARFSGGSIFRPQ